MIKSKKVTSALILLLLIATMLVATISVEATEFIIDDAQQNEEIEFIIDDAEEYETTDFIIDDAQENLVLCTEPATTNKISSNITGVVDIEKPVKDIAEESTQPPTETYTDIIIENPTQAPTYVTDVENFTYTNVTTTSITLNWTKNETATGYVIYRMDNKTNSQYVKYAVIKDNNITSYTNKNLTPARCYYYQIKSYLYKDGKYYYSAPQTVKLGTCPNGVQNLTVTGQTDNKIGIKWDKVDGASGYVIYRMDYKTNSKYKAIATVDSSVTKISNTSLETGRPYYYRVRAFKDVYGKKFYGAYPTVKTATLPASVTNLKVSSQSTTHISISWDRVPRATGYVIYRMDNTTNSKYKHYDTVVGNSIINYTDDNLIAGRCYYYRVRAYRTVDGKTYYGGYPTLKTGTKTIPPQFTLTSEDSKITASWSKVSGAEGYAVYVAESKNAHYYMQGSTTDTTFTTKAFTHGKTYYVRVCAYNLVDGKKIYSGYQTKSISCKSSNPVLDYNVGDTYIAISIDDQRMWYYKDGECVVTTPVVTGMKDSNDTKKGLFYVWEKISPVRLVDSYWDIQVNYWIGITSPGIGLHDTNWRADSDYGSDIYTYDGSNGCIYTPYNQIRQLYSNCDIGTPVVIY